MKTASIRPFLLLVFLLSTAGLGWPPASAQSKPVPNPQLASKQVNARVDALLKQMTLDEKVGQLAQFSAGYATGPGASNLHYEDLAARGEGRVVSQRGGR